MDYLFNYSHHFKSKDIKLTKRGVNYYIIVETEEKPEKMEIKVIPLKYKGQSKQDFLNSRIELITQITYLLEEYQ